MVGLEKGSIKEDWGIARMTIWEEYKKEGKGDGRVKITLVD
jgi:hypothetical protein